MGCTNSKRTSKSSTAPCCAVDHLPHGSHRCWKLSHRSIGILAEKRRNNELIKLEISDSIDAISLCDSRLHTTCGAFILKGSDQQELCMHCLLNYELEVPALERMSSKGPALLADAKCVHSDLESCKSENALICRVLSVKPPIAVCENGLSLDHCKQMLEALQHDPNMQRSRVAGGKSSDGRTSRSMFVCHPGKHARTIRKELIRCACAYAIQRARSVLQSPRGDGELRPVEPLQVALYEKSDRFCRHYDNPSGTFARAVTSLGYLCNCEKGGATYFPFAKPLDCDDDDNTRCGGGGVRVQAMAGRVLVFWSIVGASYELKESLHEGEQVQSPQKGIVTQWLSESWHQSDCC